MNELPLRDIHLPDAISWWPLAIGWWLLPLIVLAGGFAIYRFLKYKQENKKIAYRNMALDELNNIQSQFKTQQNTIELIRSVSALLRRISLSYLPREEIASLTGEQWIKQLNQLSSQSVFTDETATLLAKAPYMKQSQFNPAELLELCEQWIKLLPATRNNVEARL